jgi:hypothetical protein
MSTEPIDGSKDAQVVSLRATDAGTETRIIESPGPRMRTCRTAGRSASRSSPPTGAPGSVPASM